jgi:hypothetical protein
MKLHPIHLNRTIKTERPIALTRSDLRKLERVAEHWQQSGTPLHWMIQDADVAGSSFGGFVVSANSIGGFGSATAPIREPFLN